MNAYENPATSQPATTDVPGHECTGFDDVVRMIGGKWKLKILRQVIFNGTQRFNELKRNINGITQTMLTKQLRELEQDGLVTRTVYPEVPPRVEYAATDLARDLGRFFEEMRAWAGRHEL